MRTRPLPLLFRMSGWVALLTAAAFTGRSVYEQTVMTWQSGVQALGFSMIHLHPGWFVLGGVGTMAAHVWVIVFVVIAVYGFIRNRRTPLLDWVQCALLVLILILLYIPYGCWQYATLKASGPGNNVAQQLSYATTKDQRYLVRAFVNAGVPVDAPGPYGGTALNEACRTKRIDLARYLHSRGADLDRAPECRFYDEFARKMKPLVAPPKSNRPQIPGISIEVH